MKWKDFCKEREPPKEKPLALRERHRGSKEGFSSNHKNKRS